MNPGRHVISLRNERKNAWLPPGRVLGQVRSMWVAAVVVYVGANVLTFGGWI